MREAQQETMTQTFTVTYPKRRINKRDIERPDSCFRRPAAETPADLGQVTGERPNQPILRAKKLGNEIPDS